MSALPVAHQPANETEHRLLDVALTLFAAKGYEGASVREIITAAGVSRPVLYYYCRDKEDLFKRVVRWKHDTAYEELGRQLAERDCVEKKLQAVVRGSFAFCRADPRLPRLMFQTYYGPALPGISEFMEEVAALRFAIICGVMEQGLQRDQLRGGPAATLALAFCCLIDQHLNLMARREGGAGHLTDEFADGLVGLFLHGASGGPRESVSLPEVF